MEYPKSPFNSSFNRSLITQLEGQSSEISDDEYQNLMQWLCSYPKISSYRVNTLKTNVHTAFNTIKEYYLKASDESVHRVDVEVHSVIPNVIIIRNVINNPELIKRHNKEIIIDANCASAVLRGADIYAPGVIGMTAGTQLGENVSIYADLNKKCKKGFQKLFEDQQKLFIGNGVVKMQRHQLFNEDVKLISGIAVEVMETISGCRCLKTPLESSGDILLQNLPSTLCVEALNAKPGETVLDMCASPGNKTTHIAELMKNMGVLIAIDKTPNRVANLKVTCDKFGAKVFTFVADSTKILTENPGLKIVDGPPFLACSFDKILLDAPCSGLGKRPQLINKMSENEIKSYVPLQRKLIKTAVELLKSNGVLVYSTCTVTLAENEGVVAWVLKKFKNVKLFKSNIRLGGPGWRGTSLSEEERMCVQRFGPDENVDSVGFFFACFVKT